MKPLVNRRFLIGFLIVVVLVGVAVEGLHAFQVGRQGRFVLEEAHRAQKAEQIDLAVRRFQQYIKLAPDDSDAQAEFGLFLAEHYATREAAVVLEGVLRAQPNRDDLRRQLAKIELGIGRRTDAESHVQVLLVNSPSDAALWDLLGTCQASGGQFGPAADSLQKALGYDTHQVDAYEHLAEVLRQLDRPAEADAWMDKMVQANPASARAHLLAGQYLTGIGREKEARQQAEKALELAPKDFDALLLASRLAAARAAFDQARDYAQQAIDAAPRNAAGYSILAQIEVLSGNRNQAIARLETGAEQTQSRDEGLLWELARLRIQAGDLGRAQTILEALHRFPPDDRFQPLIGYLEAQIELAHHRWQSRAPIPAPGRGSAPGWAGRRICSKEVRCQAMAFKTLRKTWEYGTRIGGLSLGGPH